MAAYNTAVIHHDSLVTKILCTAFASRSWPRESRY